MDPIRILIADDHTLFRQGLRAMIGQVDGFEVVGEASTGTEAVARARELMPDVILMDINMPGMTGTEATSQIVRENPHVGVILVTMHDSPASVFAGMRAGARGYVLKEADIAELRRAIEAAHRGEILMNPAIAAKLLDRFERPPDPRPAGIPFDGLTPRELEVLRLAAEGLTNSAIASRLVLSEKTVKNHVNNIFSKLQVNDRAQAIVQAIRKGLVTIDPDTPRTK